MGKIKPVTIIIIIIIAVVGAFLYYQTYPPTTPDRQPPANEHDAVERLLEEGVGMDLASPDRKRWDPGDVGIFTLGIRNGYNEMKTYYVNVYLEELGGELEGTPLSSLENTKAWFTYPSSVLINANSNKMETITMRIPQDALRGSYLFRVIVCEKSDCVNMKTSDVYSSTTISMYVRA